MKNNKSSTRHLMHRFQIFPIVAPSMCSIKIRVYRETFESMNTNSINFNFCIILLALNTLRPSYWPYRNKCDLLITQYRYMVTGAFITEWITNFQSVFFFFLRMQEENLSDNKNGEGSNMFKKFRTAFQKTRTKLQG